MALFAIINLVVFSTVIAYFAVRLANNFWIFFILFLILSPILGALFLAIWDYYKFFIKGKV